MKFNFKKIASVLATTVMLGSTVAFASAAWPAPFVQSGAANGALVVGTAAAASDMAAATNIKNVLDASVTVTTGGEVSGDGDKYLLEKPSTKWHVGNGAVDIVSATIDDDELPTLLKEGKYIDNDNDEFDYTQKITLANFSVSMFDDNDYLDKDDNPTVGIRIVSGGSILNYTLEFQDTPEWNDTITSDIPIMGKEYYVLSTSVTPVTMTLLDSAEKILLSEGETKTVTVNGKPYECSIAYISTSEVKLTINEETTNTLNEAETQKLRDGTYIGIRDIMSRDVAGVSGQVEFGIGSGKLKLTSGADIELNDVSQSRLKANITAGGDQKITSIRFDWSADGDKFIAPGSDLAMPGFGAIKFVWDKLETPKEENIVVKYGGDDYAVLSDFPLKDSTENVYLVYSNDSGVAGSNFTGVGKDASNILRTSNNATMVFDDDTDDYFIVSWSDSRDAESYMVRATGLKTENGINKTTFEYRKDQSWVTAASDRKTADVVSLGNAEFTINRVDYELKEIGLTAGSGVEFDVLFSKEGMKFYLPWVNTNLVNVSLAAPTCVNATAWATAQVGPWTEINNNGTRKSCYQTTWKLQALEEDKDGNIGLGSNLNVTIGFNSASSVQTTISAIVGGDGTDTEIGSTDVYRNFVYSALATEYLWDKGGDQDWVKIVYHGEESMAKLYIAAPSVTAIGSSGVKIVKDNEVSSVSDKNLIVVGGACVNKAAAMIVAGSEAALCGDAWAAKTGAGVGKYLIQVAASPYNAAKMALLVAGYDAADTTAAANKVKTEGVDASTVSKNVYPLATA